MEILLYLAFWFSMTCAIFCIDFKSSFDFSSKTTLHEPPGKGGREKFEPKEVNAKINKRLLKKENDVELYGLQVVGNPLPGINNEEHLYLYEKDRIARIYSRSKNTTTWTIGLSFITLMQKKLDLVHPKVCKNSYDEDDKEVSTRYLSLCETDPTNSLVKLFDYNTLFEQTVIYVHDETGIKHISFDERFNFNGYYFAKIFLENRGKLRLLDNAEDAQGLPDCGSQGIEECIRRATNENGYTMVAKSVEDLIYSYLHVPLEITKPSKTACKLGTLEEINGLNDRTKATGALNFLEILKRVEQASPEELIDCLNVPENSVNRHALVSIFGINGKLKGFQAVEQFKTKGEDETYNDLWPTYLTMLSYAPDPEKALVEAMLDKSTTSENVDKTFSLSLGSLLRHYCRKLDCSMSSKEGQKIFSTFESKLKLCTSDDCFTNVISGMSNLRLPYFVLLLKNYLCSKHKFISQIFYYLKTLDSKQWSTPEIRNLMFHIFANRCPISQNQSWRIMAADLLLASVSGQNEAKETLLRLYGSLGDRTSAEQEIIAYLSAAVRHLSKTDENFRETFEEMKGDKYFNEFLIFLSKAQSSTHRDSLSGSFPSVVGSGRLDIEFSRGMLKRSLAEFALKFDNETSVLLAFELFSSGVSKVASAFGLTSGESDDGDINQGLWSGEEVTAGMTLTLFDSQQTPLTFFSGEAQLMGAVLSASGENMIAFNNTLLLNRLNIRWPLLNGLTIELDIGSALSFKLSGSIEISIWYKTSHSIVTENMVFVTNGVFALKSGSDNTLYRSKINISAKFGAEFITDIDFNSEPFSLCLQIDHSPHQLKFKNENSALKAGQGIKKDSVEKWTNKGEHKGQGVCLATHSKIHKACTDLLGD